jgi:hypothetical protein
MSGIWTAAFARGCRSTAPDCVLAVRGNRRATPSAGMHRPSNAPGLSPRAASAHRDSFRIRSLVFGIDQTVTRRTARVDPSWCAQVCQ